MSELFMFEWASGKLYLQSKYGVVLKKNSFVYSFLNPGVEWSLSHWLTEHKPWVYSPLRVLRLARENISIGIEPCTLEELLYLPSYNKMNSYGMRIVPVQAELKRIFLHLFQSSVHQSYNFCWKKYIINLKHSAWKQTVEYRLNLMSFKWKENNWKNEWKYRLVNIGIYHFLLFVIIT